MKRSFAILLALLTLSALTVPAFADLIWEPTDDQFYKQHRHECEYEGRSYYANGKKGFITVWDAPGDSTVRAQYENGEKLWVGYIYKDWALVSWWEAMQDFSGWVPLKDLYLIYDHISFEEEYGDQFRDYNGEFADYEAVADEEFWLYIYEYPLAPKWRDSRPIGREALDALRGRSGELGELISKVYTDPNGIEWGYVAWLYGIRDFWFMLDNPTNNGVMCCTPDPELENLLDSGEIVPPREPVMPGPDYTPYVLVAGVVIVTAGLLKIFWKKKK